MKKILCIFCVMFLLGGCGDGETSLLPDDSETLKITGDEQPSLLPEDLENALIEYLNYEAWCDPNNSLQNEMTCLYNVYRKSVEDDPRFPETFLEIERDGNLAWYRCTYTRQKVYCIQALNEPPEELQEKGSGELVLPEVTQPVFADSVIKKKEMQYIQGNIDDYCARAFEKEYRAGEYMEVYVADFCMENGMMPLMYIICGDEICELYSGLSRGIDWMLADMHINFWTQTNEDGTFVTVAKEDVDEEKFARVCQIAVLHAECKNGEELKLIPDTTN